MAELQSSLPLIDLSSGYQIVLEAIDPTTGAAVSGVTVANAVATVPVSGTAPEPVPLPAALAFEQTT